MPSKRDDKAADLTVGILREIRDEAKKTNARLDQTNVRLDQTNARLDALQAEMHQGLDALRTEMHEGFDLLGKRIDNVLLDEHRREHEELRGKELRGRVARIEQPLGLTSR